ncbi:MAG: preprotein translocase subunit YajC [Gammaproteobacteria bacterium]|nr:preprotein translocase subunit YajC [Gammaproteobacteria bacterium]NND54631.1 preprotein translocase subunit YajC [Gammaproteobacteria bacterium]
MEFFISNAYAQDAGGQGSLMSLLPLVLIFVVFYFLLIRPQTKRQKEHREMVDALKVGDEVTTAGGLLGKVTEVKENFVRVELADNVVVTVQRHTVSTVMPKGTIKSV